MVPSLFGKYRWIYIFEIHLGKNINILKSTEFMKQAFIFVTIMISFLTANSQSTENGLFDQSSVKMSEIKTNTARSDFGTAIIGDTIYFSSYRDELIKKSDKDLRNKEFYDIYKAGIDADGNVISNRKPVNEFYTGFHNGPVSWCPKTGELFVTQSNIKAPSTKYQPFKNEDYKLKIIIAKQIKGNWKEVEEFPYNNAEFSTAHPAINESGDTLLFASDMPGGFGAIDIYMSVRKSGKWDKPVNLGPNVNTSGIDEFPFITGDSYTGRFLIFASTGHNSIGGLDLFYTRLNDPKGEVHQFQAPINSISDDFAMNLPENGEFGFLTSNRTGTGNDDIYKLTFTKQIKNLHEILIMDAKSRKPIPGAVVNFCEKQQVETGVDGKTSAFFEKNSVCNITASAFGYKDNYKIIKTGFPKLRTTVQDTILLDMIVDEKITLKNIYYDFDRWDILPESAKTLDRLVSFTKENPEMKVELISHTDSRGSKQYNLKLSQLRAQSAVDYIVSKGIDKSKVKGIGYGESQLINHCSDGVECMPAEHRENRRTELFIPGFLKGEPVVQFKGDYSDGRPDHGSGYSSYKEHGAIFEKPADAGIRCENPLDFNLILGSFSNTINASKYIKQLKSEGYTAIILNDSEPFRVGNKFRYFSQAKKALDELQTKSYIGWIIQGN